MKKDKVFIGIFMFLIVCFSIIEAYIRSLFSPFYFTFWAYTVVAIIVFSILCIITSKVFGTENGWNSLAKILFELLCFISLSVVGSAFIYAVLFESGFIGGQ